MFYKVGMFSDDKHVKSSRPHTTRKFLINKQF